ncbi:hypothetical protein [Streptomyces niveus]|uniref:hypothetical protein n=1 Tax=Streptomyces niveus TaxID=193462 RepID=UPI0003C5C57C|nr:hypothetical protein [Streptomyces niveus]EST19434.1 hypothetical protein M877_36455 [Streptomyces niveus NCIMB 11891]
MTTPGVRLVPHTHWDREWYEPFQRFRLRPVDIPLRAWGIATVRLTGGSTGPGTESKGGRPAVRTWT